MSDYDGNVDFWKRTKKKIQSDYICRPQALELLGDVQGKRVIDIGCGDGYVSRLLAKRGAKVTAVDISEGLIQAAMEQEAKDAVGVEYRIGSALNLEFLAENFFDCAVSVMVFGHFDHDDVYQSLRETHRVLKSGGTFVLAVPHPAMYIVRPRTKWVEFNNQHPLDYWDDEEKILLRTNDSQEFPVDAKKNTIAGYLNGLISCGFLIQEISEPRASVADMKECPEMWGCEDKVPFYLIIKVIKK